MSSDGKNLHPVLKIILQRAKEKSKPLKRTDPYKVGLAIEGGAMRGVVSAGMLVAMERLGFRDCFDAIYGISIGTGNAAWFLSNQLGAAMNSYYERVNNFSFINPLRLIRKKPILSISYVEELLNKVYPLDFDEIKRSGIKLGVIVVRVDGEEKNPLLCLSNFENGEDLMEALAAAVHIPFIAGKPYLYKGMKLWDGGLLERIPVPTAIKDGCTHILTLLNETLEERSHIPKKIQLDISIGYLKRYNPKLIIPYFLDSYKNWDSILSLLKEKEKSLDKPPYILTIALPLGSKTVFGFELRHKALVNAAKKGAYAALNAFGLTGLRVEEELMFTDRMGKIINPLVYFNRAEAKKWDKKGKISVGGPAA